MYRLLLQRTESALYDIRHLYVIDLGSHFTPSV